VTVLFKFLVILIFVLSAGNLQSTAPLSLWRGAGGEVIPASQISLWQVSDKTVSLSVFFLKTKHIDHQTNAKIS
jgi:hypothetical protein